MIITIDGASGTGKSTVAKQLADQIGYIYFDTGAMYRSFTYGVLHQGIQPDNMDAVLNYLKEFQFDIRVKEGQKHYYVGEKDVSEEIRGQAVTAMVSTIAAIKEVRERLVTIQRNFAKGTDAVFEGRDMGTVVFPEADLKIFLTGRVEVRAERRYKEFCKKFPDECKTLTLEQVIADINERDHRDSTRDVSPLKQAEDAHVVDTSDLSVNEVVARILQIRDAAIPS